jgi:hypothetical protein
VSVKIFLSTVSDEFRTYRDLLRSDLTRHNAEVKVQEDVILSDTATLVGIDLYIQHCDAVVHLVGEMAGLPANPASAAAVLAKYPDLPDRFPPLRDALAAPGGLTYTQWEAWLALYHRKPLMIGEGAPGATGRGPKFRPDDASRAAQQAHLERLRGVEAWGCTFTNPDHLAKQIALSTILDLLAKARGDLPPWQPRNLPYASLGLLFKGRDVFMARLGEALADHSALLWVSAETVPQRGG